MSHSPHAHDPEGVARSFPPDSAAGDAADQAERLSMIMEAEAIASALRGESGEGSLDGLDYPLEDIETVVAMEDADDASDDPYHAGGLEPDRWMPAEQSAMRVIDPLSEATAPDQDDADWAEIERLE